MFEAKQIELTSDLTNKSALAMAFTKYAKEVDSALAGMAKDGMIDCDALREMIGAGIKGGGGKIVLKPEIPGWARMLGVSLKDIVITTEEAEEFFTKTIPQVSPSMVA